MRLAAALVVVAVAAGCCAGTHSAARHRAELHGLRPGSFAPTLVPASARAGATVTIAGTIPRLGESGRPVRVPRLAVWWNLDPRYPSPSVRVPSADGTGGLVRVLTIPLVPGQRRYRAAFRVPRAPAGLHVVGVVQEGHGNFAALGWTTFVLRPGR